MNQRQANMIQSAIQGIKLARAELAADSRIESVKEVLAETILEEETRPMTIGRACYLACYWLVWQDAGSPDLCD